MRPKGTMEPNRRSEMIRTKHQLLPPLQPYPWLLYFNANGKKNQTFCSISDTTKNYSRSIPELVASQLWTVQHGWCLLANKIQNATKLFLWNPSNLMKINLPPLKHKGICEIILSSSPTATDQVCSIFLFSALSASNSIFYCQLGEKQWTEVDYSEDVMSAAALEGKKLKKDMTYLTNPVYCNGYLYAESQFGDFLVIIEKLQPHGLKINSVGVFLPKIWQQSSFDSSSTLLESNNQLYQIQIFHAQHNVIAVVVHKLDFTRMVWEKVESIKGRVFFISNVDLPFSCPSINTEAEGGRIYFTLENFVYIYNIENNTIMISQHSNNCSSPWWFMTDLRITGSLEERGQTQIISGDVSSKEVVDDEASNAFATLPLEMVEKIAKHLHFLDYLHFRATSKLFRVAAPLPSMSVSRLSLSPLLVCFEKDNILTMAHPTLGLKYKYSFNLPEDFQGNCEICYSKDGWLLMVVNTFSNLFFNPFTREVKKLAFGPRATRNTRCAGFSHPPTSPECMVIEFSNMLIPHVMKAHRTFLGKEVWESMEIEDTNFPLYNMSPTYYKGKFYYVSEKEKKLGVLEVGEDGTSWEELEEPYAPCTGYYNNFLVECNGNLLSVFEGRFGKWVRVFKLNESKKTWMKVESLGNHMLFVGNTSLSAVANIPGMENKIYFPRFFDQDIVFYSLETNKYRTFKSEVVNFHDVREQLNSCWIEPRWN